MQEKTREKLIFIIGVLAFIIAGVSFVFAALDILSILQAVEWDFNAALQTTAVYEMAVDLVFSGLELAMGLMLIKQWKEGEKVEVYKTLSRLVSAVVYASFVKVAVSLLMGVFLKTASEEQSVGMIYCIVYFVYYVLSSSTGTLVRKRQWMTLYWMILINSVLAVGFCGYDCVSVLQAQGAAVEIGTAFANALLMGLIVAFSTGVVVYYAKDPDALWRDVLEGEDYDVVGNFGGYEVVRIYATRAQEGIVNVIILILYALCTLVGLAGIVFYAVENEIGQYFGGSVQAFIGNMESIVMGGDIGEIVNIFMLFIIVLFYPFVFLSPFLGTIRRKASDKINVMSIAGMGMMLVLLVGLSAVTGIFFDFLGDYTIEWGNYSLFEAALIILYVVFRLTKRIYANTTKEISDGVLQGDSYHSHSGAVAKICLFSGIYSVIGLGLIFAMNFVEGNVCVSYLLFSAATLFVVVGLFLEQKYPFNEFEKAKRKIVEGNKEEQESTVQAV